MKRKYWWVAFIFSFSSLLYGDATPRLSLREIAQKCHADLSYTHNGEMACLKNDQFELKANLNSARYELNGVHVHGQFPIVGEANSLYIAKFDWNRVLVPMINPQKTSHIRRIALDAGHGGNDTGAKAFQLVEKELTLDIVRRIKKYLEAQDFQVILTRANDQYIPLEKRSQIANQQSADLLISIHLNAADSPSARGIETYIIPAQGMPSTSRLQKPNAKDQKWFPNNNFDAQNLWLGYCLERSLKQQTHATDRGLKCGRFIVLEEANCPAALIECGFITSTKESALIRKAEYRDQIARAIAHAIQTYSQR